MLGHFSKAIPKRLCARRLRTSSGSGPSRFATLRTAVHQIMVLKFNSSL